MPDPLLRREFLASLAGPLAGAALAGSRSWALAAEPGENWAFPLLGDVHIDRPEHHDMAWLAGEHGGAVKQVENYCRITRELTPRLFQVIGQQTVAVGANVPFIVQLGDLVEGLCGSRDLAEQQAQDAIRLVQAANWPAPLLFTKGNHDVTGPGADEVYRRTFVPFMRERSGGDVSGAAFTREQGGLLMVFYDAYDKASLDWFAQLVEARRPERLLFCVHPPIVPYNARSTWHLYSSPRQAPQRERLLNLLGQTRAIVLCGHLHKHSFLVRRTPSGSFTQLALSSVASTADGQPRDERSGLDQYGPELVQLEPNHSPDTIEQRRAALVAEQPFIERFEYDDSWGHGLVRIDGANITVDVHRGFSRTPHKTLDLTRPLG